MQRMSKKVGLNAKNLPFCDRRSMGREYIVQLKIYWSLIRTPPTIPFLSIRNGPVEPDINKKRKYGNK